MSPAPPRPWWAPAVAVAAVGAAWSVSAVALLAGGVPGGLVPRAAAAVTAAGFGGHATYAGPLLGDEHGAALTGWPLSPAVVALAVLGTATAARHRRPGAAVAPASAVALIALLAAALARAGRYTGSTGDGGPLAFSVPAGWAAAGALVLGAVAVAVGQLAAPGVRGGGPGAGLHGPLRLAGAVAAAAAAATLVLVGYAGTGGGRLAALALAAPDLAILLVLVAAGVPVHATSSDGGLLASVPLVGAHVVAMPGGGGRATLTLADLAGRHPAWLALPVVLAVVLLLGGARIGDRALRPPYAVALALACTAVVVPLATVALSAPGGGGLVPLTARLAPSWGLGPAARGGLVGAAGRRSSGRRPAAPGQDTVRRTLRLTALPNRVEPAR